MSDFSRTTRRVACSNCGVVSEVPVTTEPPEDFPNTNLGLRTPRVDGDKSCAVCGSNLTVSRNQPTAGSGGGQV
jgi:hypothetical protein